MGIIEPTLCIAMQLDAFCKIAFPVFPFIGSRLSHCGSAAEDCQGHGKRSLLPNDSFHSFLLHLGINNKTTDVKVRKINGTKSRNAVISFNISHFSHKLLTFYHCTARDVQKI
jgi:hypothetical protein